MEEVRRLQSDSYWPGFDPGTIAAAVFDGEDTYLFDFPFIPRGFRPVEGRGWVCLFPGQHPSVIGNRRVQLEGVWVATSIPRLFTSATGRPFTLTETAAVLIHEKFHVFQALRHPDWKPNDLVLFDYPSDTVDALTARRTEIDALRRAVRADRREDARAWARASLDIRRQRLAALPARHARYERESQRLEGLAEYVEFLARGHGLEEDFPASGFAPGAAREMAYGEGRWVAALLDRLSPGWKEALEAGEFAYPEQRLDAILRDGPAPRAFSPAELRLMGEESSAALERKNAERSALAEAFESKMGTSVEIAAGDCPLHVEGFDPFTVEALGGGKMLHTQWLVLKNDNGIIQIYDKPCLTEVNDRLQVVRLVITGISARRPLVVWPNRTALAREGIVAVFRDVRVSERSGRWLIRLKK
jgi:hypothetical protein